MIVSLATDKVPLVLKSQQGITGVSKHLCGAATGEYYIQRTVEKRGLIQVIIYTVQIKWELICCRYVSFSE
jgi:hypothetical protein